jgi:SNF2 family DNA or RNA helicase
MASPSTPESMLVSQLAASLRETGGLTRPPPIIAPALLGEPNTRSEAQQQQLVRPPLRSAAVAVEDEDGDADELASSLGSLLVSTDDEADQPRTNNASALAAAARSQPLVGPSPPVAAQPRNAPSDTLNRLVAQLQRTSESDDDGADSACAPAADAAARAIAHRHQQALQPAATSAGQPASPPLATCTCGLIPVLGRQGRHTRTCAITAEAARRQSSAAYQAAAEVADAIASGQRGPTAVMQAGQLHKIFREHWQKQHEDRKAYRLTIPDALTAAQRLRFRQLVNTDNWAPPNIDAEVAGRRRGVTLPSLPAGADRTFAYIPEAHPDDILLPAALMPIHGHAAAVASGAPTMRQHQIDGIRFLWERLVELPHADPATGATVPAAGCILAHSMGLGKTCQVLSFVFTYHRCVARNCRVLLLVPKSTLVSWASEIRKWQPYFYNATDGVKPPEVYVFDDAMKREHRIAALRRLTVGLNVDDPVAQEEAAGIYMMSYEGAVNMTMTANSGEAIGTTAGAGPIIVEAASLHVDLVIGDEGHRLKSDKRMDTRMVSQIRTSRRLLLTGTPLQNHLQEYYCMINVVMPNYFPKKMFRNFFARPIARSMTKHADARTIEHARQRTFTLIREVDHFVQRRDGSVLTRELPKLLEFVVVVPLTAMQERLYDQLLAILRKQGKKVNILQAFSYAAKLCAHPQVLFDTFQRLALAAYARRGGTTTAAVGEPLDYDEDAAMMIDSDDSEHPADDLPGGMKTNGGAKNKKGQGSSSLPNTIPGPSAKVNAAKTTTESTHARFVKLCEPPKGYAPQSSDSGKMQLALEIIRHCVIALKEKVLVFSMSTVLLDFVQTVLEAAAALPGNELLGQYLRIDGSSSTSVRREQIEAFQGTADDDMAAAAAPSQELRVDDAEQKKYPIFLLSTKAGGVGLTLTAATRILILDCSWNPADDRQAIGRAYRYGQVKPVFVYRLVCNGTIEHRIFEQKVAKEWLFQTVVDSEMVKRDQLKGVKLQNFLFRSPHEDQNVTPEAVKETDKCCRADTILNALRRNVVSVMTHNTMLEEDDEQYGEAERQFYEQYKKRGGFLGAAGDHAEGVDAADAAAHLARANRVETALAQQSLSLVQVLQSIINNRASAAIASAVASPAHRGLAASLTSAAVSSLLDDHRRARIGQPRQRPRGGRVDGPGASRADALAVDDESEEDDGGQRRRPPQPRPIINNDDDVMVIDDD